MFIFYFERNLYITLFYLSTLNNCVLFSLLRSVSNSTELAVVVVSCFRPKQNLSNTPRPLPASQKVKYRDEMKKFDSIAS